MVQSGRARVDLRGSAAPVAVPMHAFHLFVWLERMERRPLREMFPIELHFIMRLLGTFMTHFVKTIRSSSALCRSRCTKSNREPSTVTSEYPCVSPLKATVKGSQVSGLSV